MSRRQAREVSLQALFQLDFNPIEGAAQDVGEAAVTAAAAELEEHFGAKDKGFAVELVNGTLAHLSEIDELIGTASKDWSLARMAGVDRNIVRMALFELKFKDEEITPNIVINEAVELAKKYGTDDSSRFVNGVLGAILRK